MSARKISVIGLGYVGLPVAVGFGKAMGPVIAFDIDRDRIAELKKGHDRTGEVSAADFTATNIVFTDDAEDLKAADFHIVTVPTPIDGATRPDLSAVFAASRTVAGALKPGDIVVYESTVYPGVTEDHCLPLLEALSGLSSPDDFSVAYSPERINPGDHDNRLETIVKVVAGQTPQTCDIVAGVYGRIVEAGIHQAPSIKVAEAAKVIENTQRDVNIALMNEFALIFGRLGIDTGDVLAAARTKWNFLPFTPGLVGGHCIGVDPYYLTYRAQQAGYHPEVILSGRRINDDMGRHVARETIKMLMQNGMTGRPTVTVLGVTFKENVPDVRNTRVIDIVDELQTYGAAVQVCDPLADAGELRREYGLELSSESDLMAGDAVVLAVPHRSYVVRGWPFIDGLLRQGPAIVSDIKGVLDRDTCPERVRLWRL